MAAGELAGVTEPAPAARTAAATPALPSPPADRDYDQVADVAGSGGALVRVTSPPGELVSVQARERIEHYTAAATAPNTARAYRHDWGSSPAGARSARTARCRPAPR